MEKRNNDVTNLTGVQKNNPKFADVELQDFENLLESTDVDETVFKEKDDGYSDDAKMEIEAFEQLYFEDEDSEDNPESTVDMLFKDRAYSRKKKYASKKKLQKNAIAAKRNNKKRLEDDESNFLAKKRGNKVISLEGSRTQKTNRLLKKATKMKMIK